MSRLILKPTFKLEGTDPSTGYDVEYSSGSGILRIGCQEHSLADWKSNGADLVADEMVGARFGGCGCASCLASEKERDRRRAAAVRKYLPRLTRTIEHIENAEAALKSSLRAQTKRA